MTAIPSFTAHTPDSAPTASRPALDRIQASVGMIPNLAAAMAESPALVDAFATLRESLAQDGTLSPAESEAVSLVNAVENGCAYCTAIHSTMGSAAGLDDAAIEQIRAGQTPADPKLGPLVAFARTLVKERGHLQGSDFAAFLDAGYTPAQALELVARLALSVMANYSGHILKPRPDEGIKVWYRSAT